MTKINRRALVVLSGGQDSATCAAWAAEKFRGGFECVSFRYGQRHSKELTGARKIADLFGAPWRTVEINALEGNPASGLTNPAVDVNEVGPGGLPKSFVPGRNLVFLTSAASIALGNGISDIVTGVCHTDYSGYPDCRLGTIKLLELAINMGNEGALPPGAESFVIHTPLMNLTKKETVLLAESLPRGRQSVGYSWTCYLGGAKPCGTCGACVLRIKGFAEAGVTDPALEE